VLLWSLGSSLGLSFVIVLWQMCCCIAFLTKLTSRVYASEQDVAGEPLLPAVEVCDVLGTLKKQVTRLASWQSCAFTLAVLYIIIWILVASQQRTVPLWAHFNLGHPDVAVGMEPRLIHALNNTQNQTVDAFLLNFLPHLKGMLRQSQPFWEEGYCAAAMQFNAV